MSKPRFTSDAADHRRRGQPSERPQASKPRHGKRSAASDAPPATPPTDGQALAPGLHIVATPIGNLGDITLRALAALRQASVIACEDTRVTGKLTAHYDISTQRIAYNDHNGERVRPFLMERLRRGESVALVSDAGMPLVSDPGYKLVRAAVDEGIAVTVLPGATATLAALALSGLPSDRFLFAGFLPPRAVARRRSLAELAAVPATLIVFESPRRLAATLAEMEAALGDRPAAIARELTKRFEEVRRGALADLARHYRESGPPKGEVVIVVGPPATAPTMAEADPAGAAEQALTLDARLRAALAESSLRDAAASVAAATGLKRRAVYARALALAAEDRER